MKPSSIQPNSLKQNGAFASREAALVSANAVVSAKGLTQALALSQGTAGELRYVDDQLVSGQSRIDQRNAQLQE